MIEYSHLINWLFFGVVAAFGGGVLQSMRALVKNVSELNAQIAVVLEKCLHHERQLDEHGKRIQYLERR